jgi:hypothetical protein
MKKLFKFLIDIDLPIDVANQKEIIAFIPLIYFGRLIIAPFLIWFWFRYEKDSL